MLLLGSGVRRQGTHMQPGDSIVKEIMNQAIKYFR